VGEIWQKVSSSELARLSRLKNPYDALAVFRRKKQPEITFKEMIVLLDDIQDPGNLGTIIRTAAWFGIRQIVCSPGTADIFNPKTLQAAAGAIAESRIYYENPRIFLQKTDLPVYAADLQGENIFKINLPRNMILVMGNEGHGIGTETEKFIKHRIHIPKAEFSGIESLNVSVSAALIMGKWFEFNA
jgi:TrmH family RNA methyltransferase